LLRCDDQQTSVDGHEREELISMLLGYALVVLGIGIVLQAGVA